MKFDRRAIMKAALAKHRRFGTDLSAALRMAWYDAKKAAARYDVYGVRFDGSPAAWISTVRVNFGGCTSTAMKPSSSMRPDPRKEPDMKPNRFRGFDHMSFAAMEREERTLALNCFRSGNMAQGEIHFENAIIFARCDGAEQAEKTLSNL